MVIQVGDYFVDDINRLAQGVVYATDNGPLAVQDALGALNNSRFAREAVEYAYRHDVVVIASAADEAAQHHHWPESYPHVIVVNSVTKYDDTFTPAPRSYLQFNGCTNFSSKVTVAIPSVSCSSDATGRGSGMAGIIVSAALNARHDGTIGDATGCRRVGGAACAITPNEVRQLMASGRMGSAPSADDVSFSDTELSCFPVPTPACINPQTNAPGNWAVVSPLPSRRYPARDGHDQFYGYGRVNMNRAASAVDGGLIPPQVEITSPEWFAQVDPARSAFAVRAQIDSRGASYTCRVLVAPGSYPNNATTTDVPPGDFKQVDSTWCDGATARTQRLDGQVAAVDVAALKAMFPVTSGDFTGREPGIGVQTTSGRPNTEPYGFVVRIEATTTKAGTSLTGEDRRNLYLHRDKDLLDGFPRQIGGDDRTGEVESSPLFADLDGDNRNELVIAGSDGVVHAMRRDGSELPGWPVKTDPLALHGGSPAFTSGEVDGDARGAILASVAAGDLDHDGAPEVVASDMEGKTYAWDASGHRVLAHETNPDWSGRAIDPFVPERHGHRNRVQHGFIASPVLADVDRNDGGKLEIVLASMDRHVYVLNDDGSDVPGFPKLVVDPTKVAAIDPRSDRVTFDADAGDDLNQGAIVDTPAVGDITGDARPEIVVGTNEEYKGGDEPAVNAANFNGFAFSFLGPVLGGGNGRLYAIKPQGDADGDPKTPDFLVSGAWPMKIGLLQLELLPVVGEGVTGSPIIGKLACNGGTEEPKIGAVPDAGPAYILNPDGKSCFGQDSGQDRPLQSAGGNGIGL